MRNKPVKSGFILSHKGGFNEGHSFTKKLSPPSLSFSWKYFGSMVHQGWLGTLELNFIFSSKMAQRTKFIGTLRGRQTQRSYIHFFSWLGIEPPFSLHVTQTTTLDVKEVENSSVSGWDYQAPFWVLTWMLYPACFFNCCLSKAIYKRYFLVAG